MVVYPQYALDFVNPQDFSWTKSVFLVDFQYTSSINVAQIKFARNAPKDPLPPATTSADPCIHTTMTSHRRPPGHHGPPRRGRTQNAYERGRPDPPSRDLYEGLNEESTEVISKPSLDTRALGRLQPKNLVYLSSYNWIEATVPSIIVPGEFLGPATLSVTLPHFRVEVYRTHLDLGSPRIWINKPVPVSVTLDTGCNFVDQSGHRMGSRTLLPLIRAVQDIESQSNTKEEDKFNWSSVDFVTDRNGLRKLLRWIFAEPGDPPKDFRIDMQLAGSKTVLMNRWEQFTKEEPGVRRSYGFNFEEVMTIPSPGCERGTGYHRIITYVGPPTIVLIVKVVPC